MEHRKDRYARLRATLRRGPELEVRDELTHHLESRIEEYVAAGMDPGAARDEALRRLGDLDRYARETGHIDAGMERRRRRRERIGGALREIGRGARTLGRSPWFALVAVLTLGLGLGATGSMYSLLDAAVLRPLPYPSSDRLVWVSSRVSGLGVDTEWGLSVAGYFDYREKNASFSDLGGYVEFSATLTGAEAAERVSAVAITASLQNVLGFHPVAGRLFTERDDEPGASSTIIVSHSLWMRRFGGDPGLVGKSVDLNGISGEVVGVLARGVDLPDTRIDVWVPAGLDPSARPVNSHYVSAIGRLADGVPVASAQRDLARLTSLFTEIFPTAYSPSFMRESRFEPAITVLGEHVLGSTARVLWILFASVSLVFLIASANVANLFIVRADVRRRESAVRIALGGSRADLAGHYMAESMLVAGAAAMLGLTVAWTILRVLPGYARDTLPRLADVGLGGMATGLVLALAVVSGLLFGTFPLLRAPRDAGLVLREGGRGMTPSRRQRAVRGALVTGQIALALTLLAGAALMLRSYSHLLAVEPGLDARNVVTFEVTLPSRYSDWEATNGFHRALIARLETLAGVEHAATTTALPMVGGVMCASLFVEDQPPADDEQAPCLEVALVSPGYFEVLGIEVAGRVPGWEDNDGRSGAVVVSGSLARRFWPDGSALGRGIRGNGSEPPFYRVAGVTSDVRGNGLDQPATEAIYFPLLPIEGAQLWSTPRSFTAVVRQSAQRAQPLLPEIRRILAELDPDVPLANIRPMESIVADSMASTSFMLLLLALAAAMALVLSMVGMYGVVSYLVGQRRAEIGVRLALGASRTEVTRMVVVRSLWLAGAGITIGLALTFAAVRTLRSLLFEVSPTDPLTLLGVSLLLALLTAAASWVPARRAARLDPMEVMRAE